MREKIRLTCGAVLGALLTTVGAGCAPSSEPKKSNYADGNSATQPIVFLAAASTKEAIEQVAASFEKDGGAHVRVAVGSSNALAAQIESGAPADLFLSANEKWADYVASKGLAEAQTPLLTSRLVLIAPKGNSLSIRSIKDLMNDGVKRVALAGENVPAGTYAEQALRAAGLYQPLVEQKKIVRGQDVRVTLSYVARGETDAGIVYSTDARAEDRVAVVETIDSKTYEPIVYPLVLVKRSNANPQARAFYEYLRAGASRAIFQKLGFDAP